MVSLILEEKGGLGTQKAQESADKLKQARDAVIERKSRETDLKPIEVGIARESTQAAIGAPLVALEALQKASDVVTVSWDLLKDSTNGVINHFDALGETMKNFIDKFRSNKSFEVDVNTHTNPNGSQVGVVDDVRLNAELQKYV